MSRRQPHLHLRGGVYQLRVRVPDALRPLVGKTEIWKSLHTGDLKEAQQRARIERVKIDAEWAGLRRQLAPKRVETISEAETWHLVAKWFVAAEKRNLAAGDTWETLEDARADVSALSEPDNLSGAAYHEATTLLTEHGIDLDAKAESRQKLEGLLADAIMEAQHRELKRSFPSLPVSSDAQFSNLSAMTILQPVAKNTLSTVMEAVENDPTKRKASGKTALKRDAQWRVLKEFFGEDTDLKAITRLQMRDFMKLLEKLPSNASKHFPGRTIFEAVELGGKLPKMTPETANGYMRQLGSLFRYAINERMVDADPSAGLLFQKSKVRAKDKRLPFDADELTAIFNAPLYTGCVDDGYGYAKPGPRVIRRGRFWVPLISLFSGMRLNEVCQLALDDLTVKDGVDIILIRGDDDDETKRVKTDAGVRFVPVHPELRKIGLLTYLEARRKKSELNRAGFAGGRFV